MSNSKNIPVTTFYSRKKEKFKYSEIKYHIRQYFISLKEKYDTDTTRYVLGELRDYAWQAILIGIIIWSMSKNHALIKGAGLALLAAVSISYFKDIVRIIKD